MTQEASNRATAALQRGDSAAALDAYAQVLAQTPDDVDALIPLAAYNGIDLALDTFPYNGTTTTCEALWMGVPVLTLRGQTHAGRTGASLLKQVGLEPLIAETTEAYVETAVNFANNTNPWRSAERRAELRGRMKAAPLCKPEIFVPNLEQVYREMAAIRRAALSKR